MSPNRSICGRLSFSLSRMAFMMTLYVATASPQTLEAAKRPMTFLDVIETREVEDGSISPDAKHVIYTISIPQWSVGKRFSHIFVGSTDGSAPPKQMTFTKDNNEIQPQWSRDNITFGFLSDRNGTNQLYLMRLDGGEARRISTAKDGVNMFAFSRDGKWVAYSTSKPENRQIWLRNLEDEQAAPVSLTRHVTPVERWRWSPDSTRIFFTARDGVDKHDEERKNWKFDVMIMDPVVSPLHLWSVSVGDKSEKRWTSGESYQVAEFPIEDNEKVEQFTISQDSAYLAFHSASTDRHANRLDQLDSEIYVINLTSGAIRRITNNHLPEGMPKFSPDSKWLVFTAHDESVYLRNQKLYVTPVTGGPTTKLLPNWDYDAESPSWSADSKTLFFLGGVGLDIHSFAVSLEDGKLKQLTHERGVIGALSSNDDTGLLLLTFTDPESPPDYYVATSETVSERSRWVRVSDANPQVENFELGRYETVHWKSSDKQTCEGILIYPVAFKPGNSYPLIVQLHGGPTDTSRNEFSSDFVTYAHIYAANGYAVFQPNYRGSNGYGEKFRMQIVGDYFRQAFDDIMTGVDDLISRGVADPAKLGMMGWSAGGHWSNWTLTHTDRFKAISTGASVANWISIYAETDEQVSREVYFKGVPYGNWDNYTRESPLMYIQNAKTPTLIQVGEFDRRVPKPQSDELFMALKKQHVPVEYIVYPGAPHDFNELETIRYRMVKMFAEFNWFEKWIRGKPGWFEWKSLLSMLPDSQPEKEQQESKAGQN